MINPSGDYYNHVSRVKKVACFRTTGYIRTMNKLLLPLAAYQRQAYALLRIISGFMFTFHGLQKIIGLFAEQQPPIGSQIWIGGVIELVAGILIMIGFQTRVAAFISSGTMAVAYFQFHWKFALNAAFFPIVNKGEMAALYCFVFLLITTMGSGIWSIDRET